MQHVSLLWRRRRCAGAVCCFVLLCGVLLFCFVVWCVVCSSLFSAFFSTVFQLFSQVYFLRWLRKTSFSFLEVTGAALRPLKENNLVKPKAPVAFLVLIDDLAAIAKLYNSRRPKQKVREEFQSVEWTGSIFLRDAPAIKKNEDHVADAVAVVAEPESKKVKSDSKMEDGAKVIDRMSVPQALVLHPKKFDPLVPSMDQLPFPIASSPGFEKEFGMSHDQFLASMLRFNSLNCKVALEAWLSRYMMIKSQVLKDAESGHTTLVVRISQMMKCYLMDQDRSFSYNEELHCYVFGSKCLAIHIMLKDIQRVPGKIEPSFCYGELKFLDSQVALSEAQSSRLLELVAYLDDGKESDFFKCLRKQAEDLKSSLEPIEFEENPLELLAQSFFLDDEFEMDWNI